MSLLNTATSEAVDKKLASQLPTPSGYRILLAMPELKKETDGNILLPDEFRAKEQNAANVAFVLKVGPDAYKDPVKFPTGPWCKEGDWVVLRTYSGTRMKIHGREFRFVNDDTIDGVVEDPRGIERS